MKHVEIPPDAGTAEWRPAAQDMLSRALEDGDEAMRVQFVPAQGDPGWELAGISIGERTRLALAKAGLAAEPPGTSEEQLWIAADALLEPGAVRALAGGAADSADSDAGLALAPTGDGELPAALRVPPEIPAPTHADDFAALVDRFRSQGRLRLVDIGGARCCRLRSVADARRVEEEMLASLIRSSDGFFARYFDRYLSRRISVVLVRRGIHPNLVTLAATLVGLVGAGLLASAQLPLQVLGALTFIFATILDGCDGEVARLSLRTSDLGGRLDLIGDNIVNGAVFVAIGYASFRAEPTALFLAAVGAALVGVGLATATGFWYATWLTRSGRQEAVRNTYESLVSRDFAYLILVLAVLGKLSLFVWAVAIGSNLFALLMVVLRLKEWPPERASGTGPAGRERPSRIIASALDGGRGL
jgi:phosphatidylglycerophosphate synthase